MDTMSIYILAVIIFGCILRTLVPYLKKIKDGTIKEFDLKFAFTMVLAIVIGILAGLIAFPAFIIPVGNLWAILTAAFLWGWGSQSIINNIAGWFIVEPA